MQELNSYIDHDANRKLKGMCEISRMDVGNQFTRLSEMQQKIERGVGNVVNAAGGRLVGNNHRNNNQEGMLGQLNATLIGVSEKMGKNRKETQQIQENKPRWRKERKKKIRS